MAGGWDPDRYDADHAYVSEHGAAVVDLLGPHAGERILDLGCGTGHLTARMATAGADVVGLDRSGEMLATARATHPSLPFVQGDAHRLPLCGPFDAAFSNAVLHWMAEPTAVFESVAGALRPGGRFVGEFGGHGNVAAVIGAVATELEHRGLDVNYSWYFPTVGEFARDLEANGFEVRRAELFDRPVALDGGADGLRSWLLMFGQELLAPVAPADREAVLDGIEARLRADRFRDGSWTVDYRRLRFVAIRTDDGRSHA